MSKLIELTGVSLDYPVYSIRAQSLRNAVFNVAVGGKLLRDGKDVVHVKALDKITFSLDEGDRLGIVGHNGAGKTTLLKVLAGVYEPTSGLVRVEGKISSMVDISLGLDHSLTGRENVILMGRRRGLTTREIIAQMPEILEFSDLGQFIDIPMRTYSAGMQARLVFAVATAFEPDILLLDEWIGAGDAAFLHKAQARMNSILEKSRALVLATHNFSLVKNVCNKLLVLNAGSQVYFGKTEGWAFE